MVNPAGIWFITGLVVLSIGFMVEYSIGHGLIAFGAGCITIAIIGEWE